MSWNCDQKLWKTKDGKIVPDGDPRAAVLIATPGDTLPQKPKIEGGKGAKAIEADEDKALHPAEDKKK